MKSTPVGKGEKPRVDRTFSSHTSNTIAIDSVPEIGYVNSLKICPPLNVPHCKINSVKVNFQGHPSDSFDKFSVRKAFNPLRFS